MKTYVNGFNGYKISLTVKSNQFIRCKALFLMEKEKDANAKDFSWMNMVCPSCAIYYGINFLISKIKGKKIKSI